jgi:hypothetical protein
MVHVVSGGYRLFEKKKKKIRNFLEYPGSILELAVVERREREERGKKASSMLFVFLSFRHQIVLSMYSGMSNVFGRVVECVCV